MKTNRILIVTALIAFCRSLLAGEGGAGSRAFRPAQGPEPVERASTLLQDKPPAKAPCCAAVENPKSKIENYTASSLYQAEVVFTTDTGHDFALGVLRGRPVVLTMFFASCGYACPLLVSDLQAIRERLPAELRDRAVFVLVSFDTARDTPEALARFRVERGLDGSWVLLHGEADAVRELAALLGVKYKQEADGAFAHSNLITVLNTQGEIVHQRAGLKGGLDAAVAAVVAAGN